MDFIILLIFIDSDLREVGILLFGLRRKIFIVILDWKEENNYLNIENDRKVLEEC